MRAEGPRGARDREAYFVTTEGVTASRRRDREAHATGRHETRDDSSERSGAPATMALDLLFLSTPASAPLASRRNPQTARETRISQPTGSRSRAGSASRPPPLRRALGAQACDLLARKQLVCMPLPLPTEAAFGRLVRHSQAAARCCGIRDAPRRCTNVSIRALPPYTRVVTRRLRREEVVGFFFGKSVPRTVAAAATSRATPAVL